MGSYSDEDKKAFKEKDKLYARLGALKAASLNNEGKSIPAKDMLVEADKYYEWLYPDTPTADVAAQAEEATLPIPTAAQAKVLTEISKELGVDVESIKAKVLDIAEKKYGIRKYAERIDSIPFFVKELKG